MFAVNIIGVDRIEIFSSVREIRKSAGGTAEFVYIYSFKNAGERQIEFNFGPPLNFSIKVGPGQIKQKTLQSKIKPERILICLLATVVHGSEIWTPQDFGASMVYAPLSEEEEEEEEEESKEENLPAAIPWRAFSFCPHFRSSRSAKTATESKLDRKKSVALSRGCDKMGTINAKQNYGAIF